MRIIFLYSPVKKRILLKNKNEPVIQSAAKNL
jgi:hypothetical protein